MTDRTTNPVQALDRMTAWTIAHPIGDRFVPSHIALRLATLSALEALQAQDRIRPYRMGWRVLP